MTRWLLCLAVFASPALAGERRVALVIGENRGLGDEEQLRFAESDARQVQQALIEVGGFEAGDVTLLAGATAEQVRAALASLQQRLGAEPGDRLLLYVSSHAADGALHLAGTTLPLQVLVDYVKQAPVHVGLVIIDACQSGRVTQLKGLKPVDVPVTRLQATGVEGRVLISASGADEYAQESESLGGSYFTHYLLAGLRGAADASRDGKVTLEEAYSWAWARTIEATFSSRGGVQRPAYSVDLHGAGQLVLSEPAQARSRLILDVTAPGRWLIVARSTGQLFADIEKREGPLALALPAGSYRLQLKTEDGVREQTVEVPPSGAVRVSGEELERASLVKVARKGGDETRYVLSAGGSVSTGLLPGLAAQPGGELRLRRDRYLAGPLNQLTATLGFRDGNALGVGFHQLEFELRLGTGHRFAWDRASLSIGLELGPLLVFQDVVPDGSQRTSLGLVADLAVEARLRLGGPVELFLSGLGGGAVIKRAQGTAVAPRLGAALGLAVSL